MANTWSAAGWCEACQRWDDGTLLFARGDERTWRCPDHVPSGYIEAPGRVGVGTP